MQMNRKFFRKFFFIASTSSLALVVACGSGGGGTSAADATAGALTSALAAIAANPADYASFIALLDTNYRQDGFTSAQLNDMLAADATAGVSFPNVSYSDAYISNCDASKICDMTVTMTNKDADTVSTTITLKVKESITGYKLIGDQLSAV
jgi:threonine dehydratase